MKQHFFMLTVVVAASLFAACNGTTSHEDLNVWEEGLLRNDDLVAIRNDDGRVTIKNTSTGKVTIKNIELDWTQSSRNDSLAVFCSKNKRGYYNVYTGEIAIPAQYRRAWVFEEGLAAVQNNGNIGFINHKGETVIDFKFPYYGNPLSEFVFKNGHCVVADTTGRCGVIDKTGKWLIRPEYDNVSTYKEYAIASKAGVKLQVSYDGKVINAFVLDDLKELTYEVKERCVNREGKVEYVEADMKTGLFSYSIGGRYGMMDNNCHRLTEPLYDDITAVSANMFRATLLDGYSEVILNAKGQVMK